MSRRRIQWEDCDGNPVTPEPVIAPPFSYGPKMTSPDRGQDVFELDGIAQAKTEDLRLLFARGKLPEGKPLTKKRYTTQLQLYGIAFKNTAELSELRDALEAALYAGECSMLVPSVEIVRRRLKAKYDKAFKRLENQTLAANTGGYPKEINSDSSRLLARYFLDAQGRPDPRKTKEPLSLRWWKDGDELVEAVKAVPGLAILKTWSTTFVGWETMMVKGIEKEFAKLEVIYNKREIIHSAQANVNPPLFLKQYLGIDMCGVATAPTAAPPSAPVTLDRWLLQNGELPELIKSKSPNLHMKESENVVVIGWDAGKVADEIERLRSQNRQQVEREEVEGKAAQDRGEAERGENWRRGKGHRELLGRAKKRA